MGIIRNTITLRGGEYKMLSDRSYNLLLRVLNGTVNVKTVQWFGGRHRAILWGDKWARLNYDKHGIHYGD